MLIFNSRNSNIQEQNKTTSKFQVKSMHPNTMRQVKAIPRASPYPRALVYTVNSNEGFRNPDVIQNLVRFQNPNEESVPNTAMQNITGTNLPPSNVYIATQKPVQPGKYYFELIFNI